MSIYKFKGAQKHPVSEVELRIHPDKKEGVVEIRIWYKDILTGVYHVKNPDLSALLKFSK